MGARLLRLLFLGSLVLAALPSSEAAPSPGCLLLALSLPPGPATDAALEGAGLRVAERFPVADTVLACGPAPALAAATLLPFVVRALPVETLESHLSESRALIHADFEAGATVPGEGVTIAMIDSGVDSRHPGLANAVRHSVKFASSGEIAGSRDPDAHGTHVAGILSGSGAGSPGDRQRGVAPGSKLVALDISDAFTTTNALRAFQWVHEHHAEFDIRVVTNSWGRERDDARFDPEDPVVRASDALVADGLVVVFSAGNKGGDRGTLTLEAMNPNVLTVGATSKDGDIEPYSSRGPPLAKDGSTLGWTKPDLVAPGSRIVSTRANPTNGERGHYVVMNGTSMAAPHAAAAAALLLSARSDLPPEAVVAILRETSEDRGPVGPDPDYGYGLLDVGAALRAASSVTAETIVVREAVKIPVHARGEVVTAAGRAILGGETGGTVRLPVAPADATRLELVVAWNARAGRASATLSDGDTTLGPWTSRANRIDVRADLPEGGPWTLTIVPDQLPERTTYALDGYAVQIVEHEVDATAKARTWSTAARPPEGWFEEHARGGALKNLVGPWGATRNLQAAAGLAGSAFLVGRWKRKDP